MTGKLARILFVAALTAGATTYARYRSDIAKARADLNRGSTIAQTAAGPVEYAERGEGPALLMIHGAGGGYDQGLLLADNMGGDLRVVAPSRFGYLRTPIPLDGSPAAQADAHAALLNFLGIEKAIVAGASAGAPSAIEFALRYPARVSALMLLVPRTYHPSQSIGADESAESQTVLRLVEASADFLFWLAARVSRRSVVRFLGVPPQVEASASEAEKARVSRIIRSILPLSSRVQGIGVDGIADIHAWPLEQISCPALIISSEDDLYRTSPGARFTAAHIPGSELHVFKSGGHLMVGQSAKLRHIVRDFLQRNRGLMSHADEKPFKAAGTAELAS
jgi:pimeloyl-ACP methyl ester carboxylesterase